MAQGFVNQSGGHIQIDSQVGVGTTVNIFLPRSASAKEPVNIGRKIESLPPGQQGETILLVEDDPDVRTMTHKILENLGHTVLCCDDSAPAMALLDRCEEISLLLSDVVLSGKISGIDLAEETQRRHPEIAVICMSGYTFSSKSRLGQFSENMSFLHKPFGMGELASTIREAISRVTEFNPRSPRSDSPHI